MVTVFGPGDRRFEVDCDLDMGRVICDVVWTVGDVAGLVAQRNGGQVSAAEVEEALAALRGGTALQDRQVEDGWKAMSEIV